MTDISTLLAILEIAVLIFFLLYPTLAMIDLLKNQFSGNGKLIWSIVIIFVPLLGAILYFFIASRQKLTKHR